LEVGKTRQHLFDLLSDANKTLGITGYAERKVVKKASKLAKQLIVNMGQLPKPEQQQAGAEGAAQMKTPWQIATGAQAEFFNKLPDIAAFVSSHAPFFHAVASIGSEYKRSLRHDIERHSTRLAMQQGEARHGAIEDTVGFAAAMRGAIDVHLTDAKRELMRALQNMYHLDLENRKDQVIAETIVSSMHEPLQHWFARHMNALVTHKLDPRDIYYSTSLRDKVLGPPENAGTTETGKQKKRRRKLKETDIPRLHEAYVEEVNTQAAKALADATQQLAVRVEQLHRRANNIPENAKLSEQDIDRIKNDTYEIVKHLQKNLDENLSKPLQSSGAPGQRRTSLDPLVETLKGAAKARRAGAGWRRELRLAYAAAKGLEEHVPGHKAPLEVIMAMVGPYLSSDPSEMRKLQESQRHHRMPGSGTPEELKQRRRNRTGAPNPSQQGK